VLSGIETVRRDTVPAVQKILAKSLRMLFKEPDLSSIKACVTFSSSLLLTRCRAHQAYLQRQFSKILSERFSLQDFVFSKKVRVVFVVFSVLNGTLCVEWHKHHSGWGGEGGDAVCTNALTCRQVKSSYRGSLPPAALVAQRRVRKDQVDFHPPNLCGVLVHVCACVAVGVVVLVLVFDISVFRGLLRCAVNVFATW
jgi:hypothetical protein